MVITRLLTPPTLLLALSIADVLGLSDVLGLGDKLGLGDDEGLGEPDPSQTCVRKIIRSEATTLKRP